MQNFNISISICYKSNFSGLQTINICHFALSFCSPLSFSPLSPRCVSPGRWSQCNESGWAFCAYARALVENESEQFPVASAVPVAPQWGEQRGKTTGTTIGKHNGKKNRRNNREKWKVKKKIFRFCILFNCFKIMPVHKSKEKKRKSQIFEIFFWRWAQVLSHQTLHTYITAQYITLHYSTLHYITVKYSTLHYTTVHYITVQYVTLHYITFMHRTVM